MVQGLCCDGKAYAVALKWLKRRFGHPVVVARAVIEKVTNGDRIPFGNRFALSQFHNKLRNCTFTLERMNFLSDLFSSDNLRMAITRPPPGLRRWWAKTSRINMSSCPLKHHLSRCWKYQNKSAPEKFVVARTKGLCFNCLRPGHHVEKCSSNFVCRVTGRSKKYHSSLHDSSPPAKSRVSKTKSVGVNSGDNDDDETVVASTLLERVAAEQITKSTKVFVQMVPVQVMNTQGVKVDTFALLDPCSEATLIREDLASKL